MRVVRFQALEEKQEWIVPAPFEFAANSQDHLQVAVREGDENPCAVVLFCQSDGLARPSILAKLRAGGAGQRIEPAQAGEPHEICVVRVQDGVVLDGQRRNLCVRHQISRRAKFLQ